MTGPAARDPLPGEPEHRDRWPDAARPALTDSTQAWLMVADGGRSRMAVQGTVADIRAALDETVTERMEARAAEAVADLAEVLDLDAGVRDALARADALTRTGVDTEPTRSEVERDPYYWIVGAGQERARRTLCPHGYTLLDSCPGCDADGDDAPSVAPQPTVPRAPVEALLAALDQYSYDDPDGSIGAAYLEVRHHLDTTTNQPEEGQT